MGTLERLIKRFSVDVTKKEGVSPSYIEVQVLEDLQILDPHPKDCCYRYNVVKTWKVAPPGWLEKFCNITWEQKVLIAKKLAEKYIDDLEAAEVEEYKRKFEAERIAQRYGRKGTLI